MRWTITGVPIRATSSRTLAGSLSPSAIAPSSVLCTPGRAIFTATG